MNNSPHVYVPITYPQLSTRDVLVMEFIDDIPGRRWKDVGIAPSILAQRLEHVFWSMVYVNGVFHADPHPGNLFFTPEGMIIPVDFGLVGRLTKEDRRGLGSFFFACVQKDWNRAARRLVEHFVEGDAVSSEDQEHLVSELGSVLRSHFGEQSRGWSTFGFVNDGRLVLQKYSAKLTTTFTQVAFMAFTGEGFLNEVDPEFPVWDTARIVSQFLLSERPSL